MSRHGGVVCAGVLGLALAVAGCFPSLPLNPFAKPPPPQHLTTGSVAEVSGRLQETLAQEGVAVIAQREGAGMRLSGSATSGAMFYLVIQPETARGSKRTFVSIVWERGEDPQLQRIVLQALAPQTEHDPDDSATPSSTR
jgi:hypothetical protein